MYSSAFCTVFIVVLKSRPWFAVGSVGFCRVYAGNTSSRGEEVVYAVVIQEEQFLLKARVEFIYAPPEDRELFE